MQNVIPPDLAIPPFAAEGDFGRIACGAADCDVIFLLKNDCPGQFVVTIAEKDRTT
jgi:hypothetical protein